MLPMPNDDLARAPSSRAHRCYRRAADLVDLSRHPAWPAARPSPAPTRYAPPAGPRSASSSDLYCERLGTPFEADLESPGLLSPDAIAHPPVFSRARAVARFDDGPSRQLVHRLKYGDRLELAGTMGAWMARAGEEILGEADVLVPVPLHRRRLAARRFNQSVLLARAVSRRCGRADGASTRSLA